MVSANRNYLWVVRTSLTRPCVARRGAARPSAGRLGPAQRGSAQRRSPAAIAQRIMFPMVSAKRNHLRVARNESDGRTESAHPDMSFRLIETISRVTRLAHCADWLRMDRLARRSPARLTEPVERVPEERGFGAECDGQPQMRAGLSASAEPLEALTQRVVPVWR